MRVWLCLAAMIVSRLVSPSKLVLLIILTIIILFSSFLFLLGLHLFLFLLLLLLLALFSAVLYHLRHIYSYFGKKQVFFCFYFPAGRRFVRAGHAQGKWPKNRKKKILKPEPISSKPLLTSQGHTTISCLFLTPFNIWIHSQDSKKHFVHFNCFSYSSRFFSNAFLIYPHFHFDIKLKLKTTWQT